MKACYQRISTQSNTTIQPEKNKLKNFVLRVCFLCLICKTIVNYAYAQDPQFSQFFAAPLYLNPAFTGTTKEHRFVANYRNQWRNVANGYVTYAFSYDYNMRDARSGFGLMATADKAGAVGMGTKTVGFLYSYKVKLANNWILTPGLHFAYGTRGIDKDKVVLLDQLSYGDASIPSNDPLVFSLKDTDYFDFGSGLLLYSKTFWIGASAFHMNQPNISMIGDNSELPMKTSIHGGARIRLYNGPFRRNIVPSIAPSFILKKQGSIEQLDLGVNFHYDPVMVGMWYRGMPVQESPEENQVSQDALIFLVGMKYAQFEFGYSYDITLSSLGPTSGGAHEVSLTYHLHNPNRSRPKVKYKDIPCPTFLLDN
ncbi:type IX secretion system membrane protein PorP/SprF [Catalinimonas sp. 4WD22]|uniref:PorP/SprF family type IX secretion system membrane protein n=1 Tax=Catalinimonas locisalis TaxID=3133978 RepID=UPI00310122AF